MADTNSIIIGGNAVRGAEQKSSATGNIFTKFTIANNDRKKNVRYLDVVVFGKDAEVAGKYIRQGTKVIVQGRLDIRSWEDKDGKKQYRPEIICTDFDLIGSRDDKPMSQAQALNGGRDVLPDDDAVDLSSIPF